jgi:hypothetical protein
MGMEDYLEERRDEMWGFHSNSLESASFSARQASLGGSLTPLRIRNRDFDPDEARCTLNGGQTIFDGPDPGK